ncbi:unnamed protein product [Ixodes hexagonus]
MVRPHIYDWDPDDSDHKSQAATRNRPSIRKGNPYYDPYYDYSPEDYGDYSYDPLENTSEEYSNEVKSEERPEDTNPEKEDTTKSPEEHPISDDQERNQLGAQKDIETESLTTVDYEEKNARSGMETLTAEPDDLERENTPGDYYAKHPEEKQMESVTDGEGFRLLVATTTMTPVLSQDAPIDTQKGETRDNFASRKGSEMVPIASANQAESAPQGQADSNIAAEKTREPQETQHAKEDKSAGPFFSFAEVPAYGEHRFGYRKGNKDHFVGRMETAKGPHVETVVVWGDKRGGYGKHIWDYNHKDSHR